MKTKSERLEAVADKIHHESTRLLLLAAIEQQVLGTYKEDGITTFVEILERQAEALTEQVDCLLIRIKL